LKLNSLSLIVPNRQWYIIWTPASGLRKYVAAKSDALGALSYEYGEVGSTSVGDPNLNKPMPLGAADAGSVDTAKGTFTITITNSKVGGPSAGTTLLDISPRSFAGGGNANVISTSAADLTTITPAYTLVGNSSCIQNNVPTAALAAAPLQGAVPLVVNFDATASSDPDSGDHIDSYTFDFGDGQSVTQSSPVVSHTYTSKGNYRALLSVKDSRGASNINVAQAFISALDPTDRINHALAANGGTATASSEIANTFPASSAINGDRAGANWGNGTGGWNDNTRDVYPDSLEVAFNGTKTIDEIRLFTLQDQYNSVHEPTTSDTCTVYGLLDFDVQYWDGSQWVTIPNGSVTGNDRVIRTFNFPAVTTTKIRVVVNNARAHFSRIVELEAYGAAGQ
jgi:PKD repeat protein